MEREVPGVDEAQSPEPETMRTRMLGTVLSVWTGIRDAYYGSIDQIEQALCAP